MNLSHDPAVVAAEIGYRTERVGHASSDHDTVRTRHSLRATVGRLWELSRHHEDDPSWPAGVMRTPTSMSHRAAH